jgi:hypothetical protein
MNKEEQRARRRLIEAEYIYRDAEDRPHLKVQRLADTKQGFPQSHLNGGSWVPGAPVGPKIPYRLPELLAADPNDPVFICEGEKDVDNVRNLGLVATTNSGGAGNGRRI